MKIMTFNTQHCLWYTCKRTGKVKPYKKRKVEIERFAKVIKESGADIVGLNEMYDGKSKKDLKEQVKRLAEFAGYEYYYFGEAIKIGDKDAYGNGILSKVPFDKVQTIAILDPIEKKYDKYYESRCVIKAEFKDGLTVLITHFGLNPDEQQNAVDTVLSCVKETKCVLMGDFNLTPDSVFVKKISEKLNDTAKYIEGKAFSFPSVEPTEKIDYIFVTDDIKVNNASVYNVIASDHLPIIAEIEI